MFQTHGKKEHAEMLLKPPSESLQMRKQMRDNNEITALQNTTDFDSWTLGDEE